MTVFVALIVCFPDHCLGKLVGLDDLAILGFGYVWFVRFFKKIVFMFVWKLPRMKERWQISGKKLNIKRNIPEYFQFS